MQEYGGSSKWSLSPAMSCNIKTYNKTTMQAYSKCRNSTLLHFHLPLQSKPYLEHSMSL